jgi:hypothetical protein
MRWLQRSFIAFVIFLNAVGISASVAAIVYRTLPPTDPPRCLFTPLMPQVALAHAQQQQALQVPAALDLPVLSTSVID